MSELEKTYEDFKAEWAARKAAFMALPKEEWLARFKKRMIEAAGETFDDGTSIAEYAEEAALAYFEGDMRQEGPEESADADISYWGE